jgi:putative membrane protein
LVSVANPFSAADRERIDAAIAAIERDTAADLCLVITRVSDRYAMYPIAAAALIAIVAGGLASLLRPDVASRVLVLLELLVLIVLTLLLEWLPLRLSVVPTRIKHARAQQLAHREFNAHSLADPKQAHRILLFVSLSERYVEIIADHETHALAPNGVWTEIVDKFLIAVKAGRVTDGVLAAIAACGAVLKTHHPALNA